MVSLLVNAAVAGASGFSLSMILTLTDGPYDVFETLRYIVGLRYDEYSEIVVDPELTGLRREIAKAYHCILCNMVWTSGISFALLYVPWVNIAVAVFAASGFAYVMFGMLSDAGK